MIQRDQRVSLHEYKMDDVKLRSIEDAVEKMLETPKEVSSELFQFPQHPTKIMNGDLFQKSLPKRVVGPNLGAF